MRRRARCNALDVSRLEDRISESTRPTLRSERHRTQSKTLGGRGCSWRPAAAAERATPRSARSSATRIFRCSGCRRRRPHSVARAGRCRGAYRIERGRADDAAIAADAMRFGTRVSPGFLRRSQPARRSSRRCWTWPSRARLRCHGPQLLAHSHERQIDDIDALSEALYEFSFAERSFGRAADW